MKKISLKSFLILIYTSLTLLIILESIMLTSRVQKTNKVRDFAASYTNSYQYWTEIQHAQHDFFIKYKSDVVFFQTEQNKFIKKSQIYVTKYNILIDSLLKLNLTQNNNIDLKDRLQSNKENLAKVEETFESITHLLFLRGSQKTGLIGDCFSYYNLALNYADDRMFAMYLGIMNNAFLNYLVEPNPQYYQDFLDEFTALHAYISKKRIIRDTSVVVDSTQVIQYTNTVSDDFINSVNGYKQAFGKLVSLDQKLFLNPQSNLMLQWTDRNQEFGRETKKTQNQIEKIKDKEVIKTQTYFLITFLIFIAIFLIINLTFPRIISKRIVNLQKFIDPLKTGEIPKEVFKIEAFTEIIAMSETIERIIVSLREASNFASEIGKGNFDYDFKPMSNKDTLGNALILLRDNLKQAKEEEDRRRAEDKIREWTNTGIAKFSDILRQSAKDINELSGIIIKELVNYLDANQGGIFIVNDEKKDKVKLVLASSYAYSKERKKRKEFLLGEGLIGTCAVEKATIYMTEIPEDYISITSGLGGANPRSLLIVPLKFEEEVLGVIEIASFNELEKYQIDFIEKIAESIASTISIAKINERTAQLLERAKLEAEQRSLKEEELRQNLEELQATQERAAQREQEIAAILDLVNKVAFIIELDIDGNLVSIPDRLTEFFELERSEILGRHISEFDYNAKSKLSEPEFWQDLLAGKEKKYLQKFVGVEKTYWLNNYFVPFKDKAGNVIKFVAIVFDVTEQMDLQNELLKQTEELKAKEKEIVNKVKELEKAKVEADKLLNELKGTMRGIDKTLLRAEYAPDGTFITANALHTQVLGYKLEDMKGKTIFEFIDRKEKLEFKEFWKQIAAGNSKKLTVKRKNISTGKDIWLENFYNPIFDLNGKIEKILYLAIDITELKILEEQAKKEKEEAESLARKLKASEDVLKKAYEKNKLFVKEVEKAKLIAEKERELFRNVFRKTSDAIQILKDGKFIACNEATLTMFGFETEEEFINISPAYVSPPKQPDGSDSMQKANEMIQLAIKKGTHQFDWVHRRKNGENFDTIVTLIASTDEYDQYVYAIVKDLTKDKYIFKVRELRELLENMDIELEHKKAEIYFLKKEIERLKKNK